MRRIRRTTVAVGCMLVLAACDDGSDADRQVQVAEEKADAEAGLRCVIDASAEYTEAMEGLIDGVRIQRGTGSSSVLGEIDMELAGTRFIRNSRDMENCGDLLPGTGESEVGAVSAELREAVAETSDAMLEAGELLVSPQYGSASWEKEMQDRVTALVEATDGLHDPMTRLADLILAESD